MRTALASKQRDPRQKQFLHNDGYCSPEPVWGIFLPKEIHTADNQVLFTKEPTIREESLVRL